MLDNGIAGDFLQYARRIYRDVVDDLMNRANVVAFGIGYKVKQGQDVREIMPKFVISVSSKKPEDSLLPQDRIPKFIRDIPTGVIETGPIRPLELNRTRVMRPARPGTSIGHPEGNIGTLGAIVRRGDEYFVLSNNHVLALLNEARIGDLIYQPAPGDGGRDGDAIAELANYVPVKFAASEAEAIAQSQALEERVGCATQIMNLLNLTSGQKPVPLPSEPENLVDAAIARVLDKSKISADILDLGGPPRGITEPVLGSNVVKSGRTSGRTEGVIFQVEVTVNIQYRQGQARYANQIMVTPFSEPGDSGSLVVNYQRDAVGMLFAGSDQVSVVNPIGTILSALDVELVTGPII